MDAPLITFGIIALNAQPFLEYNLRALYPFAYQIIIVEGATVAAKSIAAVDGHSTDGTLEMLRRFQITEDTENKIQIVTAGEEGYPSGFWPEKDHMSRAYAKRAMGDWLWQVDSDEFYREDDMAAVIYMLQKDPHITAVSFPYYEFFGGFDYLINGKWHLVEYPRVHRLFQWRIGHTYRSHRPATVFDANQVDLRKKKWISQPLNMSRPIHMFHYSYVLPKQAEQKVGYYANVDWTTAFRENKSWYETSYLKLKGPFFLGERGKWIFQWLERFSGAHPVAIQQLQRDLDQGKVNEPMRTVEDLEHLVNSPIYWLLTRILRLIMPPYWMARRWLKSKFVKQIGSAA